MPDDITSQPLSDGATNVPPADGKAAVSEEAVGLKDLLKAELGKDFPDDEAALKSIKDTYSAIGSWGQEKQKLEAELASLKTTVNPSADVQSKIATLEKTVKDSSFYGEHPEYKDYKDLISSLGPSPDEVVQKDTFKKYYEAAKAQAEAEKSKSVLHSNPRLGAVKDKLTQAREAQQAGNQEAAVSAAVDAVIDAYDMRQS